MPVSEPVYVNCKGSFRKYRVDSIGHPESPMRYWMLNLFKKYDVTTKYVSESKNEKEITYNVNRNHD